LNNNKFKDIEWNTSVLEKIGITELGEPSLDYSWKEKMTKIKMGILITKNLDHKLIESILEFKHKLIVHVTCTGYGGSILEPNIPEPEIIYHNVKQLISKGFSIEQLVLRIDPIIPTTKGLKTAEKVLKLFKNLGIKRVRYSFLKILPNVYKNFNKNDIKLPYNTIEPPIELKQKAYRVLKRYERIYTIEGCSEKKYNLACISKKDVKILDKNIQLKQNDSNRIHCNCPANKFQLLEKNKCPNECIYCYINK
jgi:DNA repair photolyase